MQAVADRMDPAGPVALLPRLPARDSVIEHLLLALHAELGAGCPAGRLFGEGLATALVAHLLRHHAVLPSKPNVHRGGLSPAQLQRVLDPIEMRVARAAASGETAFRPAQDRCGRKGGVTGVVFTRTPAKIAGGAAWRNEPVKKEPDVEPMKPMKPMAPMQPMTGGERWWPDDLGTPSTSGAQNGLRYAFFPEKRRLLIEQGGKLTAYDTGDHRIGGVSQQSGQGQSLTFTSQHGSVRLDELTQVR